MQIETVDAVDGLTLGRRLAKKMQARLTLADGTVGPYVRELPFAP